MIHVALLTAAFYPTEIRQGDAPEIVAQVTQREELLGTRP
jgi:hypothetical protein